MPTFTNNTTDTNAIEGLSVTGRGLVGKSDTDYGIRGHSNKVAGIRGSSNESRGVEGWATNAEGVVGLSKTGIGVSGSTETGGVGVAGSSKTGIGVRGVSTDGRGMEGWSDTQYGVAGESRKSAGVRGTSGEGRGVEGWSTSAEGVVGISTNGNGVWGQAGGAGVGVSGSSKAGVGVWGESETHEGVHAVTRSPATAAVAAYNDNPAGTGAAVFAKKAGDVGHAGYFVGDVHVSGTLTVGVDIVLANADCAEDFDIADGELADPGTVMVLGDEGALHRSERAYDTRVAGVVSGAGPYRPGLRLDSQSSRADRRPVALLGKVFCKVDASYAPIEVGDLLTTSPTPGHAMKVVDPQRAFGAVIGKALRPMREGRGLAPVLIALQ